jgi:hypothetical protein
VSVAMPFRETRCHGCPWGRCESVIPARQVVILETLHYMSRKHAQGVRKFHVVQSFQRRPQAPNATCTFKRGR